MVYRLDDELLRQGGRMVRCVECQHVWFQESPFPPPEMPVIEAAVPPAPPKLVTPETPSFQETLNAVPEPPPIPQSITPVSKDVKDATIPEAMTDRAMGMGSVQFGLFSFLMLLCLTLLPLFLAKRQVVDFFPVMAYFYETLNFPVTAPGEGLKFSEMVAETQVVDGKKKLVISAKLANISPHDIKMPGMMVILKNAYGATIKTWSFRPEVKSIESGGVFPLKLEFADISEEGKTAEVKVVEP